MVGRMPDSEESADLLAAVLAELAVVVDGANSGLNRPTPCSDYDVGELRFHTLSWLTVFAGGFTDPNGQAPVSVLEGFTVPTDAGSAVRAAATSMDAGLRSGAAERPLRLGEASLPGPQALGLILMEYQVHGWDLAVATGQHFEPPVEATAASLQFAPGMLSPDYQGEGKSFAPAVEVSATASALDRLVGLTGRDPQWTPG